MSDKRYTEGFRFVRTADISDEGTRAIGTESADNSYRISTAYEGCAAKLDGDRNLSREGALAAKVEMVAGVFKGPIREENEKLDELEEATEKTRGEIVTSATSGRVRNPEAVALLADQEACLGLLRHNAAVLRRILEASLNISTGALDTVGFENPHSEIYEIVFDRPVPTTNGARA